MFDRILLWSHVVLDFCLLEDFFFLILHFVYLFIYFWLCWVFVAVHGLSLVAASGGHSSLRCTGFSWRCLLLLRSTGSRRAGFSSCGAQAQLLRSMWDLPGPGIKPVSPALADRFSTTVPPGKSQERHFLKEALFRSPWIGTQDEHWGGPSLSTPTMTGWTVRVSWGTEKTASQEVLFIHSFSIKIAPTMCQAQF